MEHTTRRSGLVRHLSLTLVAALVAILTVLVGPAGPARASTSGHCGTDFPWGPFCQATFDRTTSLNAKEMLVRGAGPAAVAGYLCSKAPTFVAATCVYVAAKNGAELRDAINQARGDSTKCVAIRVYQIAASRDIARAITAVSCFPVGGGSGGGGGGGGGGGSWRPAQQTSTIGDRLAASAAPGGGNGGGASW
jgi:hypothetical protein